MDHARLQRVQLVAGELGFVVEPESLPDAVPARTWAFREGRIIVDHLFVVDLGEAELEAAHAAAVRWCNSRFVVPKALRVRCPHVITIGFSDQPLPPELVRWVETQPRRSLWGGENRHVVAVEPSGIVHRQAAYGRVDRQSVALTDIVRITETLATAWCRGNAVMGPVPAR